MLCKLSKVRVIRSNFIQYFILHFFHVLQYSKMKQVILQYLKETKLVSIVYFSIMGFQFLITCQPSLLNLIVFEQ
jgi:hypothetical protein